jgi:integrating conjugative element protein (TIGR03758 family)
MDAAQNAAFSAATGHSAADVNTLLASIVTVLVFIFAAWLMARVMASLRRGNATELDMIWVGLRAAALIAIAIWLVN